MFTGVLVPLDGTPEAATAMPAAAVLARATGASITLVRASQAQPGQAFEGQSTGRSVEDELRSAAQELARGGLVVDWLVRTGPAAQAIVRVAEERHSDVIVMATHARVGLSRAFAGSVSERVVADSGRLVLLLEPGGKPLDQIDTLLVPVDGSAGGALALGAAVGLARATGARLVLLDVVPPTPLWMYGGIGLAPAMYIDPVWEDEAFRGANVYVDGLTEQLRKAGLRVESRATRGEVEATIQAIAEETQADVIVMSTHALTGPARAVLGSVADAVVRTSHRPVLLVRRAGGAADDANDTLDQESTLASVNAVGR